MSNQIIKTIVFGALLGAALFWVPFFALKVLVFFLIIGFVFRFFGKRRYYGGPTGWAYADKIRTMSDEEYASFKENFRGRCGHRGWKNQGTKSEEA